MFLLNDIIVYSLLPSVRALPAPFLIIMDLKYMLKRSTQRLSDIHRVCLNVEHNMLVVRVN